MQAQPANAEDIQKRVQKAQEMVMFHELKLQYLDNMDALKHYCPELHKKFEHYQPAQQIVFIDSAGYPNLANRGVAVYKDNPKQVAVSEVKNFKHRPEKFDLHLARCTDNAAMQRFAHTRFIERLVDLEERAYALAKSRVKQTDTIVPQKINALAMFGLGLGYQLEELNRSHDIRNLLIFEPDDDVFYASLYTTSWRSVFEKYRSSPCSLRMLIGDSIEGFYDILASFLYDRGTFNMAKIFLYKHLKNDEMDRAVDRLAEYVKNFHDGWGFFEDELIGVSHTLHNFTHQPNVYNNKAKIKTEHLALPVFLIGNGPSLDENAALIRSLQDKAIIICCCVSTLSSLWRYGIKPDFITVMERTRGVMDWVGEVGDEAYRRSIRFISVNHIHPHVGNSFGPWGIALKTFDSGSRFITEFLETPEDSFLHHSVNSGSNTGLSFVGDMGFKRCFLFGIDLGYKSVAQHHSKQSAYFDQETGEDKKRYEADSLERQANFGGTALTEGIMDTSRRMMETSLRRNSHLICYNCSDGVSIAGTIALKPSGLEIRGDIAGKSMICDDIMKVAFPFKPHISTDNVAKKMDCYIVMLEELCSEFMDMMNEPVAEGFDVALVFERQYSLLKQWGDICEQSGNGDSYDIKAHHFTVLLGGSLCHLHTQALYILLCFEQWTGFDPLWDEIKSLFKEYFHMCVSVLKSDYNKLDNLSHFAMEQSAGGIFKRK